MSDYYNPRRTKKYLFDPNSKGPFKLSRSKIDLFFECPRCFYLDRRLGVVRPRGPAFTLNIAVDELLKKEFDFHRADGTPHPMMTKYKIDALPFRDARMEEWRDALRRGIQYLHPATNLMIGGGIDDIWKKSNGDLIVVDYKATAKDGKIEILSDTKWENQYKRQMEIYQWLFRQNGFKVSDTGYFFYVNGQKDREAFDGKLEFDVTIIPYVGNTDWVEKTIFEIQTCLVSNKLPRESADCDFCAYRKAVGEVLEEMKGDKEAKQKSKTKIPEAAKSLFDSK